MITQQSLQGAQHRLANHYVSKLQQANKATRWGHESRSHWLGLIDRDWAQIKHWQDWTTAWTEQQVGKANYCVAFATAGSDILAVRQTISEKLAWLLPALKAARRLNDASAERDILAALGLTYVLSNNDVEATRHLQQLLLLGEQAGDDFNIGRAYRALAILARRRGDYVVAEDYYQKCLDIFEKLGDIAHIGRVSQGLGIIEKRRGDYHRAYDHYTRYLSIVERTGREGELAVALQSVGNCLLMMRDFQRSVDYLNRAVNISRRIGYTRMLPTVLSNLATCEFELGEIESSQEHYEEAVQLARSTNNSDSLMNGLSNLGYLHAHLGDYAQAMTCLSEALELACEAQRPVFICNIQHDMSHTHIMLGNLEAAQVALREALLTAVRLGTERHKSKTLVTAVLLWHRLGKSTMSANWAGLLMQYIQHLDLHQFEPIISDLEVELGSQQYRDALETGKSLTLDTVVETVLRELK